MTKLQNEQDAIRLAVEAGWQPGPRLHFGYPFAVAEFGTDNIFSDPSFWQALGEARAWERTIQFASLLGLDAFAAEWKYHALRYFETILSGGDTKQFWESLP